MIHNEYIDIGEAVGDTISLFPINYLNRLIKEPLTPPMYNKTAYELLLKNDINKYILRWPYRLKDGLFSRHKGWGDQPDKNASFVWADDQYMGLTLLSRYSIVTNNLEMARQVAEMALQFYTVLQDPQDGLSYHGYNQATNQHSCCKWGRGNGWGLMSHLEVLEAMAAFPELVQTQLYDELKMKFEYHVQGMIRYGHVLHQTSRSKNNLIITKIFTIVSLTFVILAVEFCVQLLDIAEVWLPNHKFCLINF